MPYTYIFNIPVLPFRHFIEKGHDSPALRELLASAENELAAKKAAILGH